MKRYLTLILILFAVHSFGYRKSSFNNLTPSADSSGNYSFWVSGHFYGNSSNTTGYPCNTILGNIDMINASDEVMLICLGDMFLDVSHDIPFYQNSLFSKLKKPIYNAVGNHDITDNIYQDNFGATYYWFEVGQDIHVVLDTELDDGNIEGEQLDVLKEVEEAVKSQTINNVFVYAHRTIWKSKYDALDNIMEDNTQSLTGNNFDSDVLPIVRQISTKAKVYWFAGSIGGEAPVSFLRHTDAKNGIIYIATAVRGLPRDAMLKVHVNHGKASFETVSLTGQELLPLEEYDAEYWENNSAKEPFNWRLLPLYIKQTIFSWEFFFGAISSLIFVFVFRWLALRRRKKLNHS